MLKISRFSDAYFGIFVIMAVGQTRLMAMAIDMAMDMAMARQKSIQKPVINHRYKCQKKYEYFQ